MAQGRFRTLVCTAAFLLAGIAQAGTILVSGDSNIVDDVAAKPGNSTFFRNVLQGGTSVAILDTTPSQCCLGPADDTLNSFYNSIAGVTSNKVSGPVTAAMLAGVNVFVAIAPNVGFSGTEAAVLASFLSGGGTLFLLGDNDAFPGENANLNALLATLGSAMRIAEDLVDAGFNVANTVTDPLTAGVFRLEYAATSLVTGGSALFTTATGASTFIAVERTSSVPEPSTLLLSALGLAGLVVRRRRR